MARSSIFCGTRSRNGRRPRKNQMTPDISARLVRRKSPAMFGQLLPALLFFSLAAVAVAQSAVIFIVRHAERAAISGRVPADTGLSESGQARARGLAHEL